MSRWVDKFFYSSTHDSPTPPFRPCQDIGAPSHGLYFRELPLPAPCSSVLGNKCGFPPVNLFPLLGPGLVLLFCASKHPQHLLVGELSPPRVGGSPGGLGLFSCGRGRPSGRGRFRTVPAAGKGPPHVLLYALQHRDGALSRGRRWRGYTLLRLTLSTRRSAGRPDRA